VPPLHSARPGRVASVREGHPRWRVGVLRRLRPGLRLAGVPATGPQHAASRWREQQPVESPPAVWTVQPTKGAQA